jgi:hypothetical protein
VALPGEALEGFWVCRIGGGVEVVAALPTGCLNFGHAEVRLEVGAEAPGHARQGMGHC